MIRDELKDLMIALHLTSDLEKVLQEHGATGNSLSDKIKSFETMTEEDFEDEDDNGYSYRQYKRNLLGGNYNDLRWVAHERNQIMHQDGYIIHRFDLFRKTIIAGIRYFNSNYQDSLGIYNKLYRSYYISRIAYKIRYFIYGIFPYMIAITGVLFFKWEQITSLNFHEPVGYIGAALWIAGTYILSKVIQIVFVIIHIGVEIAIDFSRKILRFLISHKLLLILVILTFLLWDKKFDYLMTFIQNTGIH